MGKISVRKLKKLATVMRAALVEGRAGLHGNLTDFPNDCCDHAAIFLLLYLDNSGVDLTGFVRVEADLSENPHDKHIWLEKDGVIIDISADQFADRFGLKFDPVIVSRDSPWHASLNAKREKPGQRGESELDYCNRIRNANFYREAYATLRPILIRLAT